MHSFGQKYVHVLVLQMVLRMCSFTLNFFLLRLVNPTLLGFFNVRMNLLYNTICFLSREPIRMLCLDLNMHMDDVEYFAILSPLFALSTAALCTFFWTITWNSTILEITYSSYLLVLVSFSLSAFLEILVEPLVIMDLRSGRTSQYFWHIAMSTLAQKVIAFIAVFIGIDPVLGFTSAQILGSSLFVCLNIFKNQRDFQRMLHNAFSNAIKHGYDQNKMRLLSTVFLRSFIKQLLSEGSAFLMTFSHLLSLEKQAVYDAVERLGSLVVRVFLQPLEELASVHFRTQMRRGDETSPVTYQASQEFILLTRLIATLGMVVVVFGFAYSWLASYLYGGMLFVQYRGDEILFWYVLYLPVIAFNGISECFSVAILNANQVLVHTKFFMFSVAVQLPLSFGLCYMFGAQGFIMSNLIVYLVRVIFNWKIIHKALRSQYNTEQQMLESVYRRLIPCNQFLLVLFLAWIAVFISDTVNSGSLPSGHLFLHAFIGVMTFGLILCALFVWEYDEYALLFASKWDKGD